MLTVSNISKKFRPEDDPILANISFTVNRGERVGIVGPNGAGKTTLLRIITGELAPDAGSVMLMGDTRIGYLPQGLAVAEDTPIEAILYPHMTALRSAEVEVERLGALLAETDQFDMVMAEYSDALERLEHYSRTVQSGRGEAVLAGLGLANYPLDTPISYLSGGQKTRLSLASLLVNDPQLLILDEPTNHLDIQAIEWLEDWLNQFDGGVLVVSHDRTFLDRMVTGILALDPNTHSVSFYPGNYRDYVEAVRSERDKHWATWRDQQAEIQRLKNDAQQTMARAVNRENATHDSSARRLAKKVAKRAKAKEARLQRYLDSDERVEKPAQSWNLKLDLGDLPITGQDIIAFENLSIGYDRPLVSNLTLSVRPGERVAVIGQNGHGKTTLLKTMIGEQSPLSGKVHIGASVKIGYLAQEQDTLDPSRTVLEQFQREVNMNHTESRSFLHYFLFSGEDVFRSIHLLSYGERTRLMMAILVGRGANVLILDEPVNHLDIPSRELFEAALENFQGSVIAVVHDRYFVDRFADTIWRVEDGQLNTEIRQPIMA